MTEKPTATLLAAERLLSAEGDIEMRNRSARIT